MGEEAATWHYIVAFVFFLLLGAAGHVARAVFNVLPDRITDRPILDLAISDGYDWTDHLFRTEYDEAGYYRLDSYRNFRNACLLSGFGGIAVMLLSDGASIAIAAAIDFSLVWLWELFLYRWETVSFY
ncbi:hypothetical protein MRS76_02815 [Rhizobiaceae bacterium n13]|uniref:Uncharacterized protein n=1 Tax=Ferirhizobium litorale TaxID=2927786 RepID=A0AAE3Q9W4_9HYPH|nr:hypothetical protein [Fererhizobium litorale]MDI7860877.1 hypothetical protein [Fererhizobium litorale]MDI7921025.1 hypothetical protein [Fererhizobium litorale]